MSHTSLGDKQEEAQIRNISSLTGSWNNVMGKDITGIIDLFLRIQLSNFI